MKYRGTYLKIFLALLLTVVMTVISACGNSNSDDYISSIEKSQTEEKAKAENKVTLYTYVDPKNEDQIFNNDTMFYYPLLEMVHMYNNFCTLNGEGEKSVAIVKFSSRDRMIQQMSTEIMAGGGPDIIALDNELPVNKLISQGAFEDLNPYIKKDKSERAINLKDFNPNILDTGVFNGKRYMMPMLYMPDIYMTDTKIENEYGFSGKDRLTYSNLTKKLSKYFENSGNVSFLDSYESGKNLLFSYIDDNIDRENQTVNFDNDNFRKTISFLKELATNGIEDENTFNSYDENTCLFNKGVFDTLISKYSPYNYCLSNMSERCTDYWSMDDIDEEKMMEYQNEFFSNMYDPDLLYEENMEIFNQYVYNQEIDSFEEELKVVTKNDFINGITEKENQSTGIITCGFMINANSNLKDKAYEFIKYSLCERMQRYITYDAIATVGNNFYNATTYNLPVNKEAFKNSYEAVGYSKDKVTNITDKSTTMERYINHVMNLTDFKVNDGYYQKNVIGSLVDDYLKDKISQDNFITNLTSKTKIYLYE